MTDSLASSPRRSQVQPNTGNLLCPSCGKKVKLDSNWCPSCNFTGGDTMALFPHAPPPLVPILDPVGALKEGELRKVEAARSKLMKRFPQFRWRICIVSLPPETSLPLYGFWLLNVCSLDKLETAEQRTWTVLLLINTANGKAAVTTGYAAEPCMSDNDWKSVLSTMDKSWRAGKTTTSIIQFFKSTQHHLERNWDRFGNHSPNPNGS